MVPSLPLLHCESLVSVKENPDRKKKQKKKTIIYILDKEFKNRLRNNLRKRAFKKFKSTFQVFKRLQNTLSHLLWSAEMKLISWDTWSKHFSNENDVKYLGLLKSIFRRWGLTILEKNTTRIFSGPYFSVFGLNLFVDIILSWYSEK